MSEMWCRCDDGRSRFEGQVGVMMVMMDEVQTRQCDGSRRQVPIVLNESSSGSSALYKQLHLDLNHLLDHKSPDVPPEPGLA